MEKAYDFYKHYELVKKNPNEYVLPTTIEHALLPAEVIVDPKDERYNVDRQLQRTVNFGVCCTKGGRIFMSYFSADNHADENIGNWIVAICSDDGGKTFRNAFVVNPPNIYTTRVYDGLFWIDPKGRMWYLYAQCFGRMDGRVGVWAIRCDDPDRRRCFLWSDHDIFSARDPVFFGCLTYFCHCLTAEPIELGNCRFAAVSPIRACLDRDRHSEADFRRFHQDMFQKLLLYRSKTGKSVKHDHCVFQQL